MKKNLSGAPTVMRNRGRKTDGQVLQRIKEEPGLTIHEIAEWLAWTNGRVDGSVNRLVSQGEVRVEYFLRRRTLIKRVYPAEGRTKLRNLWEIHKEDIDRQLWKNKVFIYALSRSSIGLSPTRIDEWEHKAFWKTAVEIGHTDEKLLVRLPETLSDFYRLENSEVSFSATSNFVIATIEATIVPVQVETYRPRIPTRTVPRHFMISGKITEVGASQQLEWASFLRATLGEEMTIRRMDSSKQKIDVILKRMKGKGSVTSQEVEVPVEAVVA